MGVLHVTTTQGADTGLEDPVVEAFKANLRGTLLRPSDVGYEDSRKIHNGMIDHRPGLIACCAGVAPPSTQTIVQTGEAARVIQFALKLQF